MLITLKIVICLILSIAACAVVLEAASYHASSYAKMIKLHNYGWRIACGAFVSIVLTAIAQGAIT